MSTVPEAGHDAPAIERETKYRLSAARATSLHSLLQREGRFLRTETQDTTVYRDRAGFLPSGSYLRLRTTEGRIELTLKGPKTGAGLDAWRTEHTIVVGDGPVREMLALLGFVTLTRYVKYTRIFAFRGVLVYVDHVERLGWFCELETSDLEIDLAPVRDALGLREEDLEPLGYPALTSQH